MLFGHSFKGFYFNLQWPKHGFKSGAKSHGRGQTSTNTESGPTTPSSGLTDPNPADQHGIPTVSQDISGRLFTLHNIYHGERI